MVHSTLLTDAGRLDGFTPSEEWQSDKIIVL